LKLIKTLCLALIFYSVSIYAEGTWVAFMRARRLGEAIKDYGPQEHKKKKGTPGMGGIVAFCLAPFMAASVYMCGMSDLRDMFLIWSYPMLAGAVGLADDALKARRHSSEGLRSLQKLACQVAVTGVWAWMASENGVSLLPGAALPAWAGIPLLTFVGVGALNAVNITDGLDGLAASTVAASLASVFLWASGAAALSSAGLGFAVVLAFLWHNSHPAEVFMGDTGAHFWAGLLVSVCAAEESLLFIFPMCFIFGVELLTSAVQIASIRGWGRKVFRMAPLHHHCELGGMSEPKIVARFALAHIAVAAAGVMLIKTLAQ
jgi:phospho-N-acetylmuramoyl-pentapeptide-transferase